MTNLTDFNAASKDDNQPNESSSVNNGNNVEIKRRVSIARSAIQADNDRQKRNSINSLHRLSLPVSNSDGDNGCAYVNQAFSHGYPGEKRSSISSYSISRMAKCSNSVNRFGRAEENSKETTYANL